MNTNNQAFKFSPQEVRSVIKPYLDSFFVPQEGSRKLCEIISAAHQNDIAMSLSNPLEAAELFSQIARGKDTQELVRSMYSRGLVPTVNRLVYTNRLDYLTEAFEKVTEIYASGGANQNCALMELARDDTFMLIEYHNERPIACCLIRDTGDSFAVAKGFGNRGFLNLEEVAMGYLCAQGKRIKTTVEEPRQKEALHNCFYRCIECGDPVADKWELDCNGLCERCASTPVFRCGECGKIIDRTDAKYYYKNKVICEDCFKEFSKKGNPFISMDV